VSEGGSPVGATDVASQLQRRVRRPLPRLYPSYATSALFHPLQVRGATWVPGLLSRTHKRLKQGDENGATNNQPEEFVAFDIAFGDD